MSRGEVPLPASGRAAAQVIGERLPPLEDLVARVPPAVLVMLDDLFRAKFTGVRKVSAAGGGGPGARPGDSALSG